MVLRVTGNAGRSLALGASVAAHVAIVFVARSPSAEASPDVVMAAPPAELEVDAVNPADPDGDEPAPNRVERAPSRLAVDDLPRRPRAVPAPSSNPGRSVVAAVLSAAEPATPRFTISLSPTSEPGPANVGAVAAGSTSHVDDSVDATFAERAVDAPARLTGGETAAYPARARADGLEGDVHMELVVSRSGDVESVRVAGSPGHGLDEAAIAAARTFRFTPAVKEGRPVRVRVSWTMQFRLR
jgi:TonB family protein